MLQPELLSGAFRTPTGHLATVRPDGRPHVVVVTYAVAGDSIVTAVDQKPKTTKRLQRLVNIEKHPAVSFLVDHYEADWDRLWWIRVDGRATIHETGDVWDEAIAALIEKYSQYKEAPPGGPVIAISQDAVTSWAGIR